MKYRLVLFTLAAAALNAPPTFAQQAQPDLGALMGALGSMMQANTNTATAAAVVDFRELKGLLPAELPGLKRVSASGEKSGALGMVLSFAEARYEGEGNAYLTLKITDYGGTGLASMMNAGWAMSEVDRETETGYERTTEVAGHKAMEKYDTQYQNGSLEVLVAGRFMIEIDASKVPAERLQEAVLKVDLSKLAALKK